MLLEIAVVLLGLSISIATVRAIGGLLLVGIACIVAIAIFASYGIGPAPRAADAHGDAGGPAATRSAANSAIAAVAPVIGADARDVASSIAFTAVLGVVVVILLPLAVPIFQLTDLRYGVLAGLTVYAVPQVLAATAPVGGGRRADGHGGQVGAGVDAGSGRAGAVARRRATPDGGKGGKRPPAAPVGAVVHHRVLGACGASLPGTSCPVLILAPAAALANLLTVVAMAALGLGVDVRVVAKAGVKVTAAVTLSLVVLLVISLVLIRVTGVG